MILAIDTATRWTGLALHNGSAVIAETGWQATNTQTMTLAPALADMMQKVGVTFADLQAIAVAIGPGSYTGLRVGLGFAKGIALAHKLPLVGVSTLDIVMANFGQETRYVVVVAEAGRKRVCSATYRWYSRKQWQVKDAADIYSWDDLLKQARKGSWFAGEISADARKLIRASKKDFHIVSAASGTRRAGHLAEIGHIRWRKKNTDDPATLAPIYLREPGGGKVSEPPQYNPAEGVEG